MKIETNIFKIENLNAGYNGKLILKGLNLTLQKSEICCVIGEEGSGKSTFLKSITQQIKNTGKILYKGNDLRKLSTAKMVKHGIDFVEQGGNILRGFTVAEHICLALSDKSESEKIILWKEIEEIFPKMITLRNQVAGTLSGGERMILSMSCILASDAEFLILDEPTGGLAPETCNVIGDFLLRMKNEKNKTILLMEHNYDFAFKISDSVVTLKGGTLSEKYICDVFLEPSFVDRKLYETLIT